MDRTATSNGVPKQFERLRERSRNTLVSPAISLTHTQLEARDRVLAGYESGSLATEECRCLCGGEDGLTVVDRDRYGLPAPSRICRGCGVVWATPRLTAESLARFYDSEYRPLYAGSAEASDIFLLRQEARGARLHRWVKGRLTDNAQVVDIGCGAGGMLLPFRAAGHRVAGCDLGSSYLERGREEGLDLRLGSFEQLTDLAPFDLAMLSQVLEHVADVPAFLGGLRPLIAPGGLLYIEVPGVRAISSTYGDPLAYFQNAHLWNFDLASLSGVLAKNGWQLVDGTEEIRALFTPAEDVKSETASSYAGNLAAIARAERIRPLSVPLHAVRPFIPTPRRLVSLGKRLRARANR